MLVANDKNGNRVTAEDAKPNEEYFCPICNGKLRLRDGKINIKHFAHIDSKCNDTWNYDMSEWHVEMQSRFPKEQREVVVKHNGAMHRADILFKNMVVEFQHSPISYDEIIERNTFYNNAGYNVAWVFDVQEQYNDGRINITDRKDSKLIYHWSNPLRCLSAFPLPKENTKQLKIYLYWIDEYGEECFNLVIWTPDDYSDCANFKTFRIDNYFNIDTSEVKELQVENFFITKYDRVNKRLNSLPCRYSIKYIFVSGKSREHYICPRRNEFGLKASGEKACIYCRYCGAVEKYGKGYKSYCCYPTQVNEITEGHPGYESYAYEF